MKKMIFFQLGLVYLLIFLAVLARLLPHPANFAPIGALGLFSGAYISDRRAWCIPLVALFVSDVFIGFYQPIVMLSVYISFFLSALVGRFMLNQRRSVVRIFGGSVVSASILFLLSNFTLWTTGLYYPLTFEGLVLCFTMAIPFYGNSLAGDLFYAFFLFGACEGICGRLSRYQILLCGLNHIGKYRRP